MPDSALSSTALYNSLQKYDILVCKAGYPVFQAGRFQRPRRYSAHARLFLHIGITGSFHQGLLSLSSMLLQSAFVKVMNKIKAMMAIRTTAIPPYNKFFTNSMLTIQYPSFSGSLAFV